MSAYTKLEVNEKAKKEWWPKISHLFFADDSLIFVKASIMECHQLKHIFDIYTKASGQVFNYEKSSLLFSPNTLGHIKTAVQNIFNLEVVSHHEQYLGLPSMIGKNKYLYFRIMKERILNKIQNWNAKFFSCGGKEILLKAVARAIPTYAMSVFRIPFYLCDEIQHLFTKFWWSTNSSSKGVHWLSWKKLCKSKSEGGLGFRDLSSFNRALVAKQCWRLVSSPNSLVSQVLQANYYRRCSFMDSKIGNKPSFIWRSLLWGREVIETGSRWRIGSGKDVFIYNHIWLPRPKTFKPFSPQSLPIQSKVADLIKEKGQWKKQLIRQHFIEEDAECILSIPLPENQIEDQLLWSYDKIGHYHVKSSYYIAL